MASVHHNENEDEMKNRSHRYECMEKTLRNLEAKTEVSEDYLFLIIVEN